MFGLTFNALGAFLGVHNSDAPVNTKLVNPETTVGTVTKTFEACAGVVSGRGILPAPPSKNKNCFKTNFKPKINE